MNDFATANNYIPRAHELGLFVVLVHSRPFAFASVQHN